MSKREKVTKVLDVFVLPKTKILYESLGAPEPEAWKYVILFCLPLGVVMTPTILFNPEWLPFIKFYGSPVLSSLIGSLFLLGSANVLYAWWGNRGTQSERVLREIHGNILLCGGFFSVFFCGIPSFPHVVFALFICSGVGLGTLGRTYQLIKNHFRLIKMER